MDPRLIGRDVPGTGIAQDVVGRTVAGVGVLWLVLVVTAGVPAGWEWIIGAPLALLVAWRINVRGLLIAVTTAKPPPAARPRSTRSVTSVKTSDAPAGAWFLLDRDVQAQRLQESAAQARRAAQRDLAQSGQLAREAADLAWRADRDRRRVQAANLLPKAQARKLRELDAEERRGGGRRTPRQPGGRGRFSPPRSSPRITPTLRLAVVITPTEDGAWRIWPHTGTPLTQGSQELLHLRGDVRVTALTQARRRVTEQMMTIVQFVADHGGHVSVPEAGPLPRQEGPRADWECHQAMRLAQRYGLMTATRKDFGPWVRDVGRAFLGFDTPLSRVRFDLILTGTGREWLQVGETE